MLTLNMEHKKIGSTLFCFMEHIHAQQLPFLEVDDEVDENYSLRPLLNVLFEFSKSFFLNFDLK